MPRCVNRDCRAIDAPRASDHLPPLAQGIAVRCRAVPASIARMKASIISFALIISSACGSDDTNPPSPDAGTADAASIDAAPALDGFSSGVVACDERPCIAGDEVCCQLPMVIVDICVAPGDCPDGGRVRTCDGPEDCQAGELCCLELDDFGTSCVPEGTCSQIELCHDVSTCSGAAYDCCPVLGLMACSYMGECL